MLSENIKKARNDRHLSQRALADIIGVSQQTVGSWEVGRTSPDNEMLKKLASFFNVSVDYLLGRTDEPGGTASPANFDDNSEERINKDILEYKDILAGRNGQTAEDVADFHRRHINDTKFYEALTCQTPFGNRTLDRTERNIIAHYRLVDESTRKKMEERFEELFQLYEMKRLKDYQLHETNQSCDK